MRIDFYTKLLSALSLSQYIENLKGRQYNVLLSGEIMETDIAVIEQESPDGKWEVVIWIGPDRSEGEFDLYRYNDAQPKVRIRYLGNNKI